MISLDRQAYLSTFAYIASRSSPTSSRAFGTKSSHSLRIDRNSCDLLDNGDQIILQVD